MSAKGAGNEGKIETVEGHPLDHILRQDRLPHIWCPGCGLGSAMTCFAQAIERVDIPLKKQVLLSGIGCTGRIAGYVNVDSYHTTHGRAIPFATGLKIANPELCVTVFSGDGDLFAIGGNHFLHAARRNVDINVICVNNFNYGMTGGQQGPTTPVEAKTTTTRYGSFEHPFNLPYLAAAIGAVYVSRWTTLHCRHLEKSMEKALQKKGFTFIEIVSPCPTGFGRPNKLGEGLEELRYYREKSVIKNDASWDEMDLHMRGEEPIVVGDFLDTEKPTYLELEEQMLRKRGFMK
ncbi:MAG: thiamine pyrophosphate-dependent enzyme [Candidatus Thermoplasmatota archaeon]|nr:thiamine pyrophosphate-dependent enzyme [Candidatus Thermoplasmatota archaeon]